MQYGTPILNLRISSVFYCQQKLNHMTFELFDLAIWYHKILKMISITNFMSQELKICIEEVFEGLYRFFKFNLYCYNILKILKYINKKNVCLSNLINSLQSFRIYICWILFEWIVVVIYVSIFWISSGFIVYHWFFGLLFAVVQFLL
jgi:hypothetical protein